MPDDSLFKDSAPGEGPTSSGTSGAQRTRDPRVTGAEKVRKPKIHVPPQECPRWMHHRKGEYCKACGKMF